MIPPVIEPTLPETPKPDWRRFWLVLLVPPVLCVIFFLIGGPGLALGVVVPGFMIASGYCAMLVTKGYKSQVQRFALVLLLLTLFVVIQISLAGAGCSLTSLTKQH